MVYRGCILTGFNGISVHLHNIAYCADKKYIKFHGGKITIKLLYHLLDLKHFIKFVSYSEY